jgi:Mg-chelatase subunit ChlD
MSFLASRVSRTISRVLGALALSTLAACSAGANGERRPFLQDQEESAGGEGGSGAGGVDGEGGLFEGVTGGTGGGTDPASACVSTSVKAEEVALDVIVLLDRSGSMYGQNWNGATTALKQFVKDPGSDGLNIGLLFFPVDSPPDGLVCNHAHYDDLVVPVGKLPSNSDALVQSIDAESPNGGSTPMFGALEGALFAATHYKDSNPSHKVILVFASDGDPNSCPVDQNEITNIASLAKSALEYNGVETYVIAISGASVQNLNQIAAAGGTGKAFDVTGNIGEFAQKMVEIRQKALSCEYVIPAPPSDEPLEFDKVAVKHMIGGTDETEIPRAESLADCGSSAGWYYDDPQNPTKILLCPASCTDVQIDTLGSVDVHFGCKPEIK